MISVSRSTNACEFLELREDNITCNNFLVFEGNYSYVANQEWRDDLGLAGICV
jgi:hypothetical protein